MYRNSLITIMVAGIILALVGVVLVLVAGFVLVRLARRD
jgi:hypothetical protein